MLKLLAVNELPLNTIFWKFDIIRLVQLRAKVKFRSMVSGTSPLPPAGINCVRVKLTQYTAQS